ncbi:MAG TPA: flippase [Solirubrobacteraceae bacterium]|jgi:O-antigen/teichoic acid export membrane protein
MQVVMRVLNLALGVVVTALVARTLGQAGYGQWSTIFVVLDLIGYLVNFGMETIVVREAARDPEHEHEWLGAATLLRLIMLGPVIVLQLVAVVLLHRSHQMLVAGLILITVMPFSGVGTLQLIFRLRVKNLIPMLVLTLKSILWGAAAAIIFSRGGGMIALAVALAATNAVGSVVMAVAALRTADRWPRPSRARLGPLVREGIPLGISGLLITSYARIDQVLVYLIVGSRASGLYGAVYNLLDSSHFVPVSVLATISPIIAASWPGDRPRLLRTMRLAAELMAIASLGALAFASVAAAPLVRLIFGPGFTDAAPALPVLGAAFVFICFGYLNGNLLVVLGLQRRLLIISVVALVVNVAGNLVLIPLTGFLGAAWITLATEVVVFGSTLRLILRTLELPLPKPGRIGRTVLAAILLAAGLGGLRLLNAPLGALVVAACVCYPALLLGLRAMELADLRVLLRRGAPA